MDKQSRLSKPDTCRTNPARRALAGLIVVASLQLLLAASTLDNVFTNHDDITATTSSATTATDSIPAGKKTYTLTKLTIAVPSSWAVVPNTYFPNATAPGTWSWGHRQRYQLSSI